MSPSRKSAASFVALALTLTLTLMSARSGAADIGGDNYVPKFTRGQQAAQMLAFTTCTPPAYPKSALRNEETGTVQLGFTIAANGQPIRFAIEKSTGFAALDLAAIEGMRTCKFAPGSIGGKPVQSVARMQYVWTLD